MRRLNYKFLMILSTLSFFRDKYRYKLFSVILLSLAFTKVAYAQEQSLSKLVIGPPGPVAVRELFAHPDQWSQTRTLAGALLYADHGLQSFSDAELLTWFNTMSVWGLRMELEVGAIKEWGPTANDTFRAEQPIWDRVLQLGGKISAIVMDEPLNASRAMLYKPDDYAVAETAKFVKLVREHYADLKIGDIEPYPSISANDHIKWLVELQARIQEAGARPLDFYRLDVNWAAFDRPGSGNWAEVASLADSTHDLKLKFSLIYWASTYPSMKARGLAKSDSWYNGVLAEGLAFEKVGGNPDQFVVESWLNTPNRIIPENEKFSFTRSVLDLGNRFIMPHPPNKR